MISLLLGRLAVEDCSAAIKDAMTGYRHRYF